MPEPVLIVTEGTHRSQACLEAYNEKKITWNTLPCRVLHFTTTPPQRQKIGRSFNEAHDQALKSLYGEKLEAYRNDMQHLNQSRAALNKSLATLARYAQALNPASKYDSLVLELNPLRLPEKSVDELIKEFKRQVSKDCMRIPFTSVTVPYRGPFHFLSDLADDLCNDLVLELRQLPDIAHKPGAGKFMQTSKKSADKRHFDEQKNLVTLKHLWRGYLFYSAALAVSPTLRQPNTEQGKVTSKGKGKSDLFTVCRSSQPVQRLLDVMLPRIRAGTYDPSDPQLLDSAYDNLEDAENSWMKTTLNKFVRDMRDLKVQSKNSVLVEFPKWTGDTKYQVFFKAWFNRPWKIRADINDRQANDEEEEEEEEETEKTTTKAQKEDDYWKRPWTHSASWKRELVANTVALHNQDFFAQGVLKDNSVALFIVDQPFGVFEEDTDLPLSTEQQTKLWSTVQRTGLQSGAIALSYCSWHDYGAAPAVQQQAVVKTANVQKYKPLEVSPVLLYWIPNSSGAPSKSKSLRPVDLCKPILLVHTASTPVDDFHTHLDKSPDVKWATNVLHGYTKTPADQLPQPEQTKVLVQKPLSLTVEFILRYSNPDDLVCVPFAGTGTEVVAALLTGRRVVAFEKDATRFAMCKARVEKVLATFRSTTGPVPRFRFPTEEELKDEREDTSSAFRWLNVQVRQVPAAEPNPELPAIREQITTKPKKTGGRQKRQADPFQRDSGGTSKRGRVVVQDLDQDDQPSEAPAADPMFDDENDTGGSAPNTQTESQPETESQLPDDVADMLQAANDE